MSVADLVGRIRRSGPVRFDELVELALYDETGGFFAAGAGPGRRRDFLTSPELGGLFGAVVARALDTWWRQLGEPDPFWVLEGGAGRGALAHAVLEAAPECGPVLRYVCVERSAVLQDQARALVHPAVEVRADLPAGPITGVVLANELLDNLPFRLLERGAGGWSEVLVGAGDDEALREVLVPASPDVAELADDLAPTAAPGARIPLQEQASAWLARALDVLDRGRVVLVDYCATTAELAARPWTEWVRTYRGHARGAHPLAHVGEQDVTCQVAVDQLARVRPPDADRSQAAFVAAHGIDELVEAARAAWHERAHIGDIEALRHRSRVGEGSALTDPAGLGAHRVLEWVVPGERGGPPG